eukprot:356345-Chlamydomonas_euryale.AAC.5
MRGRVPRRRRRRRRRRRPRRRLQLNAPMSCDSTRVSDACAPNARAGESRAEASLRPAPHAAAVGVFAATRRPVGRDDRPPAEHARCGLRNSLSCPGGSVMGRRRGGPCPSRARPSTPKAQSLALATQCSLRSMRALHAAAAAAPAAKAAAAAAAEAILEKKGRVVVVSHMTKSCSSHLSLGCVAGQLGWLGLAAGAPPGLSPHRGDDEEGDVPSLLVDRGRRIRRGAAAAQAVVLQILACLCGAAGKGSPEGRRPVCGGRTVQAP